MWGPSTIIWAMPTPSLHSLGLGAASHVAPCQRPIHSGLVPIVLGPAIGLVEEIVIPKVQRVATLVPLLESEIEEYEERIASVISSFFIFTKMKMTRKKTP